MRKRSQSRYSGPGTFPPISPPGQREYRKLTMREEILRVLLIIGAQCFLALVSLISTYLLVAIIGPIIGVVLVATILFYLGQQLTQQRPIILIALLLWLIAGYPLCSSIWIANPVSYLHPFAQVATIIAYLFVDAATLWGIYILWIELTDPNWPSPRQAVLRDGPFIPGFTRETYGSQLIPDTFAQGQTSVNTIRVEVAEKNGSSIKYIDGIPDTPEWRAFSRHIAAKGPTSMTESAANSFKVKQNDQIVGGVLIMKGARTIKTELVDRGFAKWRSVDHGRGLYLKRPAMLTFEAIGELEE